MSQQNPHTTHEAIIHEIETQYKQIIQNTNWTDHELDDKERFLSGIACVSEIYLYYFCGILPQSLTQELFLLEQKICQRENRSHVTLKEVLTELEIISPTSVKKYQQYVTSDKSALVQHLRQAGMLYHHFFSAPENSDMQLDLETKKKIIPWVSITDRTKDSYLKLINIVKILNFYTDYQDTPLTQRATKVYADLMFDTYSCVVKELNALAERESNAETKKRISACGDMFARWLDSGYTLLKPDDRNRTRAELYTKIRQMILSFESDPKIGHKKALIFDMCMDLDDKYATKLRNYMVIQPTIKPKNIQGRLPFNIERIIETHQALAYDYFIWCNSTISNISDSEKIITSLSTLDEENLLYICGFLNDNDYDRIINTVEILASDDYLNNNPQPINIKRIFSYLMDKKEYILPIRKNYIDTINNIKNASLLVRFICGQNTLNKPKKSVLDIAPEGHFVNRRVQQFFQDSPETIKKMITLQTLASHLPPKKEIQNNLKELAFDHFRRTLKELQNVLPYPKDPDVSQRTRLIQKIYNFHLPKGNILTKCAINKKLVMTEKMLYTHLTNTLGKQDQIWVNAQGDILRQSNLTAKEAFLNQIDLKFNWRDEWWNAYLRATQNMKQK